jgi:hypothetical protein
MSAYDPKQTRGIVITALMVGTSSSLHSRLNSRLRGTSTIVKGECRE